MAWKKSPPELVRLFDELIPKMADVGRRPMFGYPAAFADGYLFAGLFEDHMLLRLGAHMDAFRAIGGMPFEPRAGRPMTGFLAGAARPPGRSTNPCALDRPGACDGAEAANQARQGETPTWPLLTGRG